MVRSLLMFAATLALAAAAATPTKQSKEERMAQANATIAECKTELRLTDDETALIDKKMMIENQKLKCFVKCIGEKYEILKNGKVDAELWKARIRINHSDNPKILEDRLALVDLCKDKVGADECDTAAQIYTCLKENRKEVNLIGIDD